MAANALTIQNAITAQGRRGVPRAHLSLTAACCHRSNSLHQQCRPHFLAAPLQRPSAACVAAGCAVSDSGSASAMPPAANGLRKHRSPSQCLLGARQGHSSVESHLLLWALTCASSLHCGTHLPLPIVRSQRQWQRLGDAAGRQWPDAVLVRASALPCASQRCHGRRLAAATA